MTSCMALLALGNRAATGFILFLLLAVGLHMMCRYLGRIVVEVGDAHVTIVACSYGSFEFSGHVQT